jgi:hypothetical protein
VAEISSAANDEISGSHNNEWTDEAPAVIHLKVMGSAGFVVHSFGLYHSIQTTSSFETEKASSLWFFGWGFPG